MMDFNERVMPGASANFLYKEALARYVFALKSIKKNYKVLDLGCGTGYGSYLLAENCKGVIALDINSEAVEYARKHYKKDNLDFEIADITKLDSVIGKFDFVCSFEVIEHLEYPIIFLNEIKQVLKRSGLFIMSTPNKAVFAPNGKIGSPYHFREYTKNELQKILKKVFPIVEFFFQSKSQRAKKALTLFMYSQKARQGFVNSDFLSLRKLFPKIFKERIWRLAGNFFGRHEQDLLSISDFPISEKMNSESEYFIAICRFQ